MDEALELTIQQLCGNLNHEEMSKAIGLIKKEMILKEGKNSDTHCVCPITYKVLNKRSTVKIISKYKMTRYAVETSWYYLSKKAHNKIINRIKERSIHKDKL